MAKMSHTAIELQGTMPWKSWDTIHEGFLTTLGGLQYGERHVKGQSACLVARDLLRGHTTSAVQGPYVQFERANLSGNG